MIGPEGKLVRPLAAVLCVDMDGRVNVNTAGSLDLADPGAGAKRQFATLECRWQKPQGRQGQ